MNAHLRRTWGSVKRGGELIMVAEAANPNWHDPVVSAKYPGPVPEEDRRPSRQENRQRRQRAYVNFAFFDGHVSLYPSVDFNTPPAGSTYPQDKFKSGHDLLAGASKMTRCRGAYPRR